MAHIFLSPSTQEYNVYVSGSNEEVECNRITDLVEPKLTDMGITYGRNDPAKTVGNSVRMSNAGKYDLHVAVHTNAAPTYLSGRLRGIDVYYFANSRNGKRAADIFVKNFEKIYPGTVRAMPTTTMYELKNTKAPAVLLEIGYHDNAEDEAWVLNNMPAIATQIANSIKEYVGK